MAKDLMWDTPRTKSMKRFLEKEKHRIVGMTIEGDGVFIYTRSHEWCDDNGSGTFRGDSETAAVKRFYARVRRGNGDIENPQPDRRS